MISISHYIACVFFFVSSQLDDSYEITWIKHAKIENDPTIEQYIHSLYFSLSTLVTIGYGDIKPMNPVEKFIGIFIELIAVGTYTYTFGLIFNILSKNSLVMSEYIIKTLHIN